MTCQPADVHTPVPIHLSLKHPKHKFIGAITTVGQPSVLCTTACLCPLTPTA